MSGDGRDGELARALERGEETAAREVAGWVRRAASPFRFRLGADWDDAVQGCLLELLVALREARVPEGAPLRGYVWRLTVRSCIDRMRSRARWRWTGLDPERGEEPGIVGGLLAAESRRQLLAVVNAVPAGCRRLWALLLAGRSYREMSEQLGVGEGALRVRVLRCRRRALALATEVTESTPGRREGRREER